MESARRSEKWSSRRLQAPGIDAAAMLASATAAARRGTPTAAAPAVRLQGAGSFLITQGPAARARAPAACAPCTIMRPRIAWPAASCAAQSLYQPPLIYIVCTAVY